MRYLHAPARSAQASNGCAVAAIAKILGYCNSSSYICQYLAAHSADCSCHVALDAVRGAFLLMLSSRFADSVLPEVVERVDAL